MKRVLFVISFLLAATVSQTSAQTVGFEAVRAMANAEGTPVAQSTVIEGVVIGDCGSPNMDNNPNLNYYSVDTSVNDCTNYIQSADGRYGFRLQFDHSMYNRLPRYARATLDLAGATVVRQNNPERYTVKGLTSANIVRVEAGDPSAVAVKHKRISELCDADVYTYVLLDDVCFTFRNGCYTNIWEPYAQPSSVNSMLEPNGRMDSWAALVSDASDCERGIYMLVNTKCEWRRSGKPVPQGRGSVGGVVVFPWQRRYGGWMGRYGIRPIDEKDINVGNKRKEYPFRTHVGWFYDDNPSAELTFENMGTVAGVKSAKYSGDAVLAEVGSGKLWSDSQAFVMLASDYNALNAANKGWVANAALRFDAPSSAWYEWNAAGEMTGTKSVFVEFSTEKLRAAQMLFCFRFGAGAQSCETSYDFPAQWCVEYSTDGGRTFERLREVATGKSVIAMRALPWWDKVLKERGNLKAKTSYDAAMGYTDHAFVLPHDCFLRKRVTVRITPANDLLADVSANPKANTVGKRKASAYNDHKTVIRFGEIAVMYR